MTIYDIDQRITELVDPETGELLDVEAFEALQMERDRKIESMALWVKELAATASAIKAEIDTLTERKRAAERKRERLERYLSYILQGEKFSTPRCSVTFRKSTKCIPSPDFVRWAQENGRDDLLTYKEPTVSLTAVKEALKAGQDVPARMEESLNVGVK